MKFIKYIACLLSVSTFMVLQSCTEDISLKSSVDTKLYEGTEVSYAYLRAVDSNSKLVDIYQNESTKNIELRVDITNPVEKIVEAEVSFDSELLNYYNEIHQTQFNLFPQELLKIENDGIFQIAPGDVSTYKLNLTISNSDEFQEGTYILPLRITKISEGIKLSENNDRIFIVVRNNGSRPSTDKEGGFVTICYIEVNGHNPLNAGEWTLATSGKQLIDIVNLFAANINYDEDKKSPYVYINKNLQYILERRDKYIKPLQDKGIKVCLSILGNGQGVGVANLSEADAKKFAQELKSIVETYGLDGVDFDDEWSKYEDFNRPGFPERGPYPYARLCYETKMAMPDKLCTVYYIGAVVPYPELGMNGFDMQIDGLNPGDFIDYSYYAQYGALKPELYQTILGMKSNQWGGFSVDMADGVLYQEMNFDVIKASGNGVQVIYDLRPTDFDAATQERYAHTFNTIAKKLYNDSQGAKHLGNNYYKEW